MPDRLNRAEDPLAAGPAALTDFLNKLGDASRYIAKMHFRKPVHAQRKADNTPVTIADREAEQALRRLIEDRFPTHSIRGEEFGAVDRESEWAWFIDPIDGTKSFMTGKPTFGTVIGLLRQGAPVAGIIDMPALDERWLGIVGQASTFDGEPCHSNGNQQLTDAVLYATTIDMFDAAERRCFDAVTERVWFRAFGADCYAYGLLASGHVDIVMEAAMSPYDYLGLLPVITGAGGAVSDWNGAPLHAGSGGRVLACASAALHEQVLAVIARTGSG